MFVLVTNLAARKCLTIYYWVQLADYKDKLVRLLADMENLRDRTSRQAEQSRSFAIQVHLRLPVFQAMDSSCSSTCLNSLVVW